MNVKTKDGMFTLYLPDWRLNPTKLFVLRELQKNAPKTQLATQYGDGLIWIEVGSLNLDNESIWSVNR